MNLRPTTTATTVTIVTMPPKNPPQKTGNPELTTRDRQILEQIGYLAIHRASKKIVTDRKKQFFNQLQQDGKGTSQN